MGKARNEVALARTGTSGTYPYPSSITTDAQGRVTAVGADWTVSGYVMSSATGTITLADLANSLQSGNYTLRVAGGITPGAGVDTGIALDTTNGLAATDKILSIRTGSVEKLYVDGAGDIFNTTSNFSIYNSGTDGVLFSSGAVYLRVGNSTIVAVSSSGMQPQTDLAFSQGTSGARWTAVFSRHFVGGQAAVPGGALGTGANVGAGSSFTITGNDAGGTIAVTTGAGVQNPDATVITVTFNATYGTPPASVVLTPGNKATAALAVAAAPFVSAFGATTFTVTSGGTALASSIAYLWNYQVIG